LIQRAYLGRAWSALGYSCWNAYCDTEFASVRLRLPREERLKMVCRLRELGLSVRAIEAATGASHTTVQKDIAEAEVYQTGTPGGDEVIDAEVITKPKPIIGRDGKTYPPRELTAYQKERKARDEAEAALTPQERARRDKEAEAFAREMGDQIIASFSGVLVNSVIGCLEELGGDIRKLVERGGVTSEQLRGIEAAHASYATELDLLRMSERGPGAST
jgi:hypothetical protein